MKRPPATAALAQQSHRSYVTNSGAIAALLLLLATAEKACAASFAIDSAGAFSNSPYTLSGSAAYSYIDMAILTPTSTAVLNVSSNFTLSMSALYMAENYSSTSATVNISAGTINITDQANIGIRGTALVNQTGGLFSAPVVLIGGEGGSHGTYLLNGGILKAGTIRASTSSSFGFNGGTLQASADGTFFDDVGVYIDAGGAKIDSNGYTMTINQPLPHGGSGTDGGLSKVSAGTLILAGANTYNGGTTVSGGVLQIGNGNTSGSLLGSIVDNATVAFKRTDPVAFSNPISGSGGIAQQGMNTLTLSNATNSYTGSTTVSAGILSVAVVANGGVASNIGQSTNAAANLVLDGGTLKYTGPAQSTNRLFTLGPAGGTIDSSGTGALSFTSTGTIGATGTAPTRVLTLTGSTNASLAAVIPDNGSEKGAVTKSGPGTWTLSGANTYTGATNVTGGTLILDNTIGPSIINSGSPITVTNGTLKLVGTHFNNIFQPSLLTVGVGGVLDAQGSVNNAHTLRNVLLQGGTLTSNNVIDPTYGNFVIAPNYILTANGDVTSTISSGALQFHGGSSLSVGTGTGGAPSTLAISAIIQDETNSATKPTSLLKAGAGTLVLTGANTYTGGTTIVGTVEVASLANGGLASPLGKSSNAASNLDLDGGTLRYVGPSDASTDRLFQFLYNGATLDASGLGSLTFTGNATYGNNIVFQGRTDYNFSLTLTGSGSGFLGLDMVDVPFGSNFITKNGPGTWTLTATQNYSGPTTVNGGTLVLGAALTATSEIRANVSGRVQLSGANRINDLVPITLAGGTFSTAGFSETAGPFSLSSGLPSTLDLGNGVSIFHLANSSAQTWNGTLTIQNWSGLYTGGGLDQIFFGTNASGLTAAQLAAISFLNPPSLPAGTYAAQLLPTGELIAVIPEPGAAGLVFGSVAYFLVRSRRRPRNR